MSYSTVITEFTNKLLEQSGLDTNTHLYHLKSFKSGHEKVDYAYTFLKEAPTFQDIFENSRVLKNNDRSTDLQKEGEETNDEVYALECFTKSISNAEAGSRTLARAFGARASLLFRKGYHSECIQDIDRALEIAEESPSITKTLKELKRTSERALFKSTTFPGPPVSILQNENPLCSSSSDHIDLKKDELVGRHFVAAKNIKAGEILIVEESFTHTMFPESQYLYCHECLSICYNPIPCPTCTKALFCNGMCRLRAWYTHHQYECNMIPLYQQLTQNFVKMVVIALTDVNQGKNGKTYHPDKLGRVEDLVTNEEKRESVNFFYPIIMACIGYHDFITNTNILNNFFVSKKKFKDLIYKCIMIDSMNSFYIKQYSDCGDDFQKIAQGMFSISSLFNHSCAPNCLFYFRGRYLIIRALSNIKRGEECSISYYGSCPYASVDYAERRRYLRDVFVFDCYCKACTEKWPTFEFLPPGTTESETNANFEMGGHKNGTDSKQADRECEDLLLQMEKIDIHPSQILVRLQKKLISHYKRNGSKIIKF